MTDWYAGLTGIQQFLLAVAVFSTIVFAIQFLMTLFELGEDGDLDHDGDWSLTSSLCATASPF